MPKPGDTGPARVVRSSHVDLTSHGTRPTTVRRLRPEVPARGGTHDELIPFAHAHLRPGPRGVNPAQVSPPAVSRTTEGEIMAKDKPRRETRKPKKKGAAKGAPAAAVQAINRPDPKPAG